MLLSCFPLSLAQSCDDITVEFDGVGAGGYAHSITYREDGNPVRIVPDNVVLTSTTNIFSIQIVLGCFTSMHNLNLFYMFAIV